MLLFGIEMGKINGKGGNEMYTNRHEKNEPKIPKALSGAENASFSHDSRLGPFYWRGKAACCPATTV